jgi:hypothetical protein
MTEIKDRGGRVLYVFDTDGLEDSPLEHLDLRNADFYVRFFEGKRWLIRHLFTKSLRSVPAGCGKRGNS